MDKPAGSWVYRHKLLIGCACALITMFTQRAYSQRATMPVMLSCNRPSTLMGELTATLPNTRYLFSDTYGWFDRTHFYAGHPEQVLIDLNMVAGKGGGIVTIHQGVRDNVMGYTAIYRISRHLGAEDVTAAALGIYMDWSTRFEKWQAQPPQGLAGPLTSFAIEDLPSQYLGFYAQATGMSVDQVFACYLGPVAGSEEGPPDFARSDTTANEDGWAGITHLQNKSFLPLVETESGWQHVNWPKPLRMTPINSSSHTWLFYSEETWYLGDEFSDSPAARYPSPSFRHAR